MTAVLLDVAIEQGVTFFFAIRVRENGALKDLTGYTGSMQIRTAYADDLSSTILATATVTIDIPTSIVTATISETVTLGFTWSQGVYDLEIYGGPGKFYRLARGRVGLVQEVTR